MRRDYARSRWFLATITAGLAWALLGTTFGYASGSLVVTPAAGAPGTPIKITGSGFSPRETVLVDWDQGQPDQQQFGQSQADANGAIIVLATVPAGASPGQHVIAAVGAGSGATPPAGFTVTAPPTAAPAPVVTPVASPTTSQGMHFDGVTPATALPDYSTLLALVLVTILVLVIAFGIVRRSAGSRRIAAAPDEGTPTPAPAVGGGGSSRDQSQTTTQCGIFRHGLDEARKAYEAAQATYREDPTPYNQAEWDRCVNESTTAYLILRACELTTSGTDAATSTTAGAIGSNTSPVADPCDKWREMSAELTRWRAEALEDLDKANAAIANATTLASNADAAMLQKQHGQADQATVDIPGYDRALVVINRELEYCEQQHGRPSAEPQLSLDPRHLRVVHRSQ